MTPPPEDIAREAAEEALELMFGFIPDRSLPEVTRVVREAIRQAVEQEREVCAQIADSYAGDVGPASVAIEIRNRSQEGR